MNAETLDSFTIDKIGDRIETTERLLEGVELTEGERRLVRMATQQKDTWSRTLASLYSARPLSHSLKVHSSALTDAARASDRHAANLARATWPLVGATAVLALATLLLLVGS